MSDVLCSPYYSPRKGGLMRKILYSTMVICLLMALTGLPAYGYGGGGGGGGGSGDGSVGTDPFAGMGPSTSGGSTAPEGFTPIVMDLPSPAPPPELSSVGETPVTGGPRQLSEEEWQRLQAARLYPDNDRWHRPWLCHGRRRMVCSWTGGGFRLLFRCYHPPH